MKVTIQMREIDIPRRDCVTAAADTANNPGLFRVSMSAYTPISAAVAMAVRRPQTRVQFPMFDLD